MEQQPTPKRINIREGSGQLPRRQDLKRLMRMGGQAQTPNADALLVATLFSGMKENLSIETRIRDSIWAMKEIRKQLKEDYDKNKTTEQPGTGQGQISEKASQ